MRLPLSAGLLSQHLTPSARYESSFFSRALVSICSFHSDIVSSYSIFVVNINTLYSSYLNLTPMSEGHANLFASAVPPNESSSTIGLNGDQPARNERSEQSHGTNSSREARNEQNTSIAAGEDADGQPEQRFPRGNDEDPDQEYSLEEESINLMDEIVENFRCKEIMKLKALSNIISILNFNLSRIECTKDATVEHYSCTLNEIEPLATSAAQQGEHAQ